ncbi:hypothetical protein ACXR2T_14910, partial [Leucobacter sp. HY1910]
MLRERSESQYPEQKLTPAQTLDSDSSMFVNSPVEGRPRRSTAETLDVQYTASNSDALLSMSAP